MENGNFDLLMIIEKNQPRTAPGLMAVIPPPTSSELPSATIKFRRNFMYH